MPWAVLPLPASCLAAISLVLTASLIITLYRAGWLSGAHRIARATWRTDGRWIVERRDGLAVECELCRDSRVAGRVVWLRLRAIDAPHRVYALLVSRSSAADDAVRRLIVRLRLDVPRSGAATRVLA